MPVLDSHLTTYHSNTGIQIIVVFNLGMSTLYFESYVQVCCAIFQQGHNVDNCGTPTPCLLEIQLAKEIQIYLQSVAGCLFFGGMWQFRALSDQLFRNPSHHKYVRKSVVKQVLKLPH